MMDEYKRPNVLGMICWGLSVILKNLLEPIFILIGTHKALH